MSELCVTEEATPCDPRENVEQCGKWNNNNKVKSVLKKYFFRKGIKISKHMRP